MVRRSKRKRVEVEVEVEEGEVSKYFKKEETSQLPEFSSRDELDEVDIDMVKAMNADIYYDWVNARTKDDIGAIEIIDRPTFPRNFASIYPKVRLMRSKIATPVDTVGCASLPITVSKEFGISRNDITPKNYRFQLLIALMLSSQTRDEANAKAIHNLMEYCIEELKNPEGITLDCMFQIEEPVLAKLIYPVSFYTRKAMYIKKSIQRLVDDFDSDVPTTIEGYLSLTGVGPKMGYLALQKAWGKVDGIGVDVHVDRLCKMWRWVDPAKAKTPEHTRKLLQEWLPREFWYEINPILVGFGQVICLPRGKRCDLCMVNNICNAVDPKKVNQKSSSQNALRKGRGNYAEWIDYFKQTTEGSDISIESDRKVTRKEL
ncbi:LAFE_0D10792g1_1 [Lachancea fermentati]|uniref:Endonuclease III homolog n=1 Tax=Lachancea fermentati TaxID=4955 RepID=A0A1G4MCF0_LACFM|nr:LAFE_0D10792g1_1 [Lachancea fermentati]